MTARVGRSEFCAGCGTERTPSGASGTSFEVALGPAHFKLRTPEAILHVPHGGLWIEADCSIDEP
eukprot:6614541-Alexandrium_andersonii.AAC.1